MEVEAYFPLFLKVKYVFVLGRLRQKDREIKPAWAMCLRRAVSKQNNNIKYIFKTWPVSFSLFGILDVLLLIMETHLFWMSWPGLSLISLW